ncbi:hypothetical protein GGS20DRAFT_535369 [Poronia punctata]|nr:hypothetical protein GGS20DRAFT_535369 [Poronia punctata]
MSALSPKHKGREKTKEVKSNDDYVQQVDDKVKGALVGKGDGEDEEGEEIGAPLSATAPGHASISPAKTSHESFVKPTATVAYAVTEDAVDDSEDLDDDIVQVQKTMSDERRLQQHNNSKLGVQDLLPFVFSPLVRPLSISDLESCVALENAAFSNPEYRCTRDKFEYRLTKCPELTMGIFCTVVPAKAQGWEIETLSTAHPVETSRSDGAVSVLLAHLVGTRTRDLIVTDGAMDYPRDYKTIPSGPSSVGHQEIGRTICLHSLAVHPKLQGVGMGKLLVKAYMQQAKSSDLAGRIALICQDYLVNYYKRFGFSYLNPSIATFGGGGWHDIVFDLAPTQ